MVIGKNNIKDGPVFFRGHSKDHIQSVGLVFEPNFFTSYYYADKSAGKLIGFERKDRKKTSVHKGDFSGISPLYAISFTNPYTLVPFDIFKEEDAGDYLHFNAPEAGATICHERLIGLEAVLVSEKDQDAETFIDQFFPGLDLKHGVGPFLEFCRRFGQNKFGYRVFLHGSERNYALAVFKNGKLVFINSILADHLEDVRYFVLYTLKQLQTEGSETLYLMGEAAKINDLKTSLKQFLTSVQIPVSDDVEEADFGSDKEFAAHHWLGLNASQCAL